MTVPSTNALLNRTGDSPATFATRWLPPSTAVISAHGEVDAANATDFADYALRHIAATERVVIDLTGVDFFGTAGFSALKAIEVRCSVGDVDWVLVPGKSVNRLLRICDPDSELRTRNSVAAALSTLNGATPLLQLVTKPR
ncbi:STAS domain-containing protein [Mycobacterium sp. CBMA247]|nr:STAS domain-containing protein [Mycolicibacterium sp. CBMA 329]MUL86845.1 STAS domain-containing protein [Mycolicibacterium sp. CBMA 331]MUL98870.1 STAS domain-containing protein [Mycolicibacterium sp. CBMA 334]MUM28981.1 STAS domain-containing protein [Mycolicibacterium sp. CBMA 295]MUM37142.1 STAS domain-containing protein [Mycolicibacterium sp. CBMA 247]MUM42910.1 STAS domain-containing protein [Mycolicibacterium sp. CBMA 294]